MDKIHLLNVGEGDCTIIQHRSGRTTVVDICGGYVAAAPKGLRELMAVLSRSNPSGNFGMCDYPSNPIDYLRGLGVSNIWRFILSHPDMDHLDGFARLVDEFRISFFWDSQARKQKPDFQGTRFHKEDWDAYARVRDGNVRTKVICPQAGSSFQYANLDANDGLGHDGIFIASPDPELIKAANATQDFNDASYVLALSCGGRKVVLPGDAHDKSWEYARTHHADFVQGAAFLLAPHHGRKSGRDFSYLNWVRPTLTLLGCAPSAELSYDALTNRNLRFYTQNQTGNVVLEIEHGLCAVYVENRVFVEACGLSAGITNGQGYYLLEVI